MKVSGAMLGVSGWMRDTGGHDAARRGVSIMSPVGRYEVGSFDTRSTNPSTTLLPLRNHPLPEETLRDLRGVSRSRL